MRKFQDGEMVTNTRDGRSGVIVSAECLYSEWYYRINFLGDDYTGQVKEKFLIPCRQEVK